MSNTMLAYDFCIQGVLFSSLHISALFNLLANIFGVPKPDLFWIYIKTKKFNYILTINCVITDL